MTKPEMIHHKTFQIEILLLEEEGQALEKIKTLLQKKSNKVSLYIFEKAISLNTGQVAGFGLKTLDYSFLSNTNKK